MKQIKNSKVMLTFSLSSVYSRLDKDVSKEVNILVSATILDGSDDVFSSWKHRMSDKCVIVFLLLLTISDSD